MARHVVALTTILVFAACPEVPPPPAGAFVVGQFPASFTWGTSTASWPTEGDEGANGPVASNRSTWIGLGTADPPPAVNARGNGFFTLYADDAARAAELGLTSFRVSVEWARIMPAPGVVDEAELTHLE